MVDDREQRTLRVEQWTLLAICSAVVGYLSLFAWRFADERLYADSGYYLARVINEGGFRIEHGRWALALAQALPLLGVKLGLTMKALILMHSLNNAGWLGVCMIIAWQVLRAPRAALALAAVHLIGLTHGLFCPIFELYYGVDLLILFHATRHAGHLQPTTRWIALIVLFLAVISCHLFGAVLMAALLALERIWLNRREMLLFALIFVAYGVHHALSITAYEKDHLAVFFEAGQSGAMASLLTPGLWFSFIRYALRHYPDVMILSLMTAAALIRSGDRWKGLGFIGVLLALQVVIAVKLPGQLHDRYREQVNFAATAWAGMLFVLYAMPLIRRSALPLVVLLIAIGWRAARAESVSRYYRERVELIGAWVEQARTLGLSKAIVPAPHYFGSEHHAIELQWSVPVESLLLSAKDGPKGTVSLITTQDLEHGDVAHHLNEFIFRRWEVMETNWLNPRYFTAPAGLYAPLPTAP